MSVKLVKNIAHIFRNKFKLAIACICLTTFIIGYKYDDLSSTASDRSKAYVKQQDEAAAAGNNDKNEKQRANGYAIYGNRVVAAKKNESKQNIIDLASIDFKPFALKDTEVKQKAPVKGPSRITASLLPGQPVQGPSIHVVKQNKAVDQDVLVPDDHDHGQKANQYSNQIASTKNKTQPTSSRKSFGITNRFWVSRGASFVNFSI